MAELFEQEASSLRRHIPMRRSTMAATAILLLAGCSTQDPEPTLAATASTTAARPSESPGEYGPVHSMTVDEAFPDGAATCENTGQMLASGQRSDVGYRLSFPEAWYTNAETPQSPACSLFHPEPFNPADPASIAIRIDMPPGGDMSVGMGGTSLEDADATIGEYTVDNMPALRVAFDDAKSLVWVVGIGGSLPRVGNDRPYLAITVRSDDPDELAMFTDVLDRVVATLEVVDS